MRSLLGRFHRPFARGIDEQLLLLNNLGDGSTLSLDFTTGVLDPRLTFTRSTTGTYINNSGYVTSASINTPRFDYDPSTLQPRGLLIEGSANNTCTYSGDMTQSGAGHWSVRTALITVGWTGFTAPDNTASAVKIIPDTTSSRHTLESSSTSIVSGTVYTASVFVKASGYTVASLVIAGGQTRRNFTLSGAGTPESQFGLTNTATITPVGTDGWYRITMTWTANATGGAGLWIGVPQNATTDVVSAWSGNGTSAIIAWGAQLETGSGASSYIPTGASTGNRAYDHCYATGTNFTSWFSTGAGTLVAVSDNTKNNTQNLNATISDDSTSNYVRMGFKVGGASNEYLLTTVGGPSSFQGAADSGYAPALNTVYKMAYAWDTNNFAIVANGGAVATDTSGTLASAGVLTRMVIGGDFVAVPNDIYFKNGHIRSLKYYPTRLANAQLQALTT